MVHDVEYLDSLRTAIVTSIDRDNDPNHLHELLEQHSNIFLEALNTSTRSADSRKRVQAGTILLDEVECSINKDFIDTCLRLADFLEIDELTAAAYLDIGSKSVVKLDRDAFNSSIYVYLAGRVILYDCLRILANLTAELDRSDESYQTIHNFFNRLTNDTGGLSETCYKLIIWIQGQADSLLELDKRKKILGSNLSQLDRDFIETSYSAQHESICFILASTTAFLNHKDTILRLLTSLSKSDNWDVYVTHRMISVMLSIQSLASLASNTLGEDHLTPKEIGQFFRAFYEVVQPKAQWQCEPLRSILQMVLASDLNAVCNIDPDVANSFDYDRETLQMARSAVEHDVFQHCITFKLFCAQDVTLRHPFSLFFRSDAFAMFRPARVEYNSTIADSLLSASLRMLCTSIIVNLADLLKDLHLTAEDLVAAQEVSELSSPESNSHSIDMFYGLVYTAFSDGEDLAQLFWNDKSSNLYGFMLWASFTEIPSTVYAFFYMMTALTNGPDCSASAIEFFNPREDVTIQVNEALPSPNCSWKFIFDSFRYYLSLLDRRLGSTDFVDGSELDPYTALVLVAYLNLLTTILSNSTDSSLVVQVNNQFEAASILFEFMGRRLPAELYVSILKLISVFAGAAQLQNIIWQMFETWLSGINAENSSPMLPTAARRHHIEHRPLTCLITLCSVVPDSMIGLIDCLRALTTTQEGQPGALTFPESLGEKFRYSGISDYVDFVWHCLLSQHSDASVIDMIARINIITACTNFFENCLSSFDVDLIYISRAGMKNIDHTISASSLQSYLVAHPGARVLQQLDVAKNRHVLLQIIKSHDTADSALRRLLLPSISTSMRLCALALDKNSAFEEFIRPLLHTKLVGHGKLSRDISSDTELLIHMSTLSATDNFESCTASVALLSSCVRLALFDKRHIAILSSADQSKTILMSWINLLRVQAAQPAELKLALLRLIESDLERSTTIGTLSVSHFFLGFVPDTTDQNLQAGFDPGQIGSGCSLFHILLELLDADVSPMIATSTHREVELGAIASHILSLLCESSKTATIVMPILRACHFFHDQMSNQQQIRFDQEALSCTKISDEILASNLLAMLQRRANFVQYCAKELLLCQTEALYRATERYMHDVFPRSGAQRSSGDSLLDWLDILTFSPPLLSGSLLNWHYFQPATFLAFAHGDSAALSFRCTRLALLLKLKHLLGIHDNEKARATIQAEYGRLIVYVAESIHSAHVKAMVHECMARWSSLAVIALGTHVPNTNSQENVAEELMGALLVHLPIHQESDPVLADLICECLSTLIHFSKLSAAQFFVHCFRTIISCLQTPTSTQTQREHLYSAGIYCLQSIQKQNQSVDTRSQLAVIAKSGADRHLTMICQDAAVQNDVVRITACAFLEFMLKMCETQQHPVLSQKLVKLNLLTRFAYQFEVSLKSDVHPETISRQLDLILRLAMTRLGAQDLIHNRTLLPALAQRFLQIDGTSNATEDPSNGIRLMSVYVACVIALGLHMMIAQNLLNEFHETWSEKLHDQARRMMKVKNSKAEEFQALLDLLAQMRA